MAERWSKEGIIESKTDLEGGYVNDPDDKGGETCHGVTLDTAREYGYTGKMKDLTRAQAFDIYDRGWWKKLKLDEIFAISPLLADRMFDFGINAGRANCVKSLQRILNVLNNEGKLYADIVTDGGMGPKTLGALNAYLKYRKDEGLSILIFALISHQVTYYTEISEKRKRNEKYTYGWYGRVFREMADYAVKAGLVK
ncbi:hypothetical protein DO649_26295 [Salmonella enterica subsp. enterica]|nr:hypothetical protein [Salmonella enterica subsp. enterica serovar Kentucky]EBW4855880.1 hypothetical protein [Salmonella enterica subsp. enterica serovar Kentucky]